MKAFLWAMAVAVAVAGCGGGGQSAECKRYVDCVAKVLGSSASVEAKYGIDGSCWTDATAGALCTKQCKSAVAAIPTEHGC